MHKGAMFDGYSRTLTLSYFKRYSILARSAVHIEAYEYMTLALEICALWTLCIRVFTMPNMARGAIYKAMLSAAVAVNCRHANVKNLDTLCPSKLPFVPENPHPQISDVLLNRARDVLSSTVRKHMK